MRGQGLWGRCARSPLGGALSFVAVGVPPRREAAAYTGCGWTGHAVSAAKVAVSASEYNARMRVRYDVRSFVSEHVNQREAVQYATTRLLGGYVHKENQFGGLFTAPRPRDGLGARARALAAADRVSHITWPARSPRFAPQWRPPMIR